MSYLYYRKDQGKKIKLIENGQVISKKLPLSFQTVDQIVAAVVSLYHKHFIKVQETFVNIFKEL